MRLSENFSLDEFTVSETAARQGIEIEVSGGSEIYQNLENLVDTVLQPLRDEIGSIIITSGYRPPKLNHLIGGAATSQHVKGEAADIVKPGVTPFEVCEAILSLDLPFDQLIHEFGKWVHVSAVRRDEPRGEVLTAFYDPATKKTKYVQGLHLIKDLV